LEDVGKLSENSLIKLINR